MVEADKARKKLIETGKRVFTNKEKETESIPLEFSSGRVIARDIRSKRDFPSQPLATKDGYAVAFVDKEQKNFTVKGSVFAGSSSPRPLKEGEAMEIATGALLPEGAEAVVELESVTKKRNKIIVNREIQKGENIKKPASDLKADELLFPEGIVLNPELVSELSRLGREEVEVYPRLQVGILNTGEELLPPGCTPGPGEKFNTNLFWLKARLEAEGCEGINLGIVGDDRVKIRNKLSWAGTEGLDLVITTGGLGESRADLMADVWKDLALKSSFFKLNLLPGKRMLTGWKNDTLYIALPGAPGAVRALYKYFITPLLAILQGRKEPFYYHSTALAAEEIDKDIEGSTQLIEGILQTKEGKNYFFPYKKRLKGKNDLWKEKRVHLILPPQCSRLSKGEMANILI